MQRKIDKVKQAIIEYTNNDTSGRTMFHKHKFSNLFNVSERLVRHAISELGGEDFRYYFMPYGVTGFYILARHADSEDINDCVRALLSSIKTIYFNKYKPLENYVTDEKLKEKMGQLDLDFLDEEQ